MSELFTVMPLPVLVIIGLMIVISVIWIAYSYLKEKTLDQIRADVYQLILKAEHFYTQSSSGKQKLKWVVQEARKLLPGWMQALISEDAMQRIIQVWFDEVKDLLDDGKVNGSNKT